MNTKFKPYQQPTIDGFIETGKQLSISESTMAFKTIIDSEIAVTFHNVITKYYQAIKPYIENTSMSEETFLAYKNKPNMYCHDVYGTPELASSLLYINNMTSVTEFTKCKFKRFKPSFMTVVNELMSLNEKDLKKNRIENNIS